MTDHDIPAVRPGIPKRKPTRLVVVLQDVRVGLARDHEGELDRAALVLNGPAHLR